MSQNHPLGDDSGIESAEERHLRTLTDQLTKACDHDVEVIQQATASSIRELEDRIEELKSVERAEIRDRKSCLERELERLKMGVPIRKLPTEILSYIFRFYVQLDLAPWCLLEVCKHWRQLATNTPQLWCRIEVTDEDLLNILSPAYSHGFLEGVEVISKGNILFCVGIKQLQAVLRLSGAITLNITIVCHFKRPSASNMIGLATSMLLGKSLSNRIETLCISYSCHLPTSVTHNIMPGSFGLLRSIEIRGPLSPWCLSMFRAISSTSSRLVLVQVKFEITQELADLQIWSRIEELGLEALRRDVGAQDLNKISQKLVNIHSITQNLLYWPNQYTSVSVWRNIHKINLACDPIHLARLKFPALSSLVIRDLRNWNEGYTMEGFAPVSYPLLDNLKVITSGPRWLSKASAPLLRQFHIVRDMYGGAVAGRGWESSPLFLGFNFPAVRELTFGARVGSEATISGLKHFSNICKLSLLSPYKDPILAVLLLLGSGTPISCPHLKQLFLGDGNNCVEGFKNDIVPEVKRLIKSRKQMGKPLTHLSVHWLRDQGVPQAFI